MAVRFACMSKTKFHKKVFRPGLALSSSVSFEIEAEEAPKGLKNC